MRAEKCSRDYRFQEHLTTRQNMESTPLMRIATLQSFAKKRYKCILDGAAKVGLLYLPIPSPYLRQVFLPSGSDHLPVRSLAQFTGLKL
jgi:hypothetical protein